MATIIDWDGGTLPTITGTTPTLDADGYMVFGAGATVNNASWAVSTNAFTLRWYEKVPSAWASASWSTFYALSSATINARVNIAGSGTPGQVRYIQTANSQIAASPNNTLALSGHYRFELQIDRAAQTYRGAIFALGSDVALYDTGLLTGRNTGSAAFTSLQLGRLSTVSTNALSVGRVKAVDTVGSWIGRDPDDPLPTPPGGSFKSWDGSSLVAADIVGYWSGSTLVVAECLGLWDGTALQPPR